MRGKSFVKAKKYGSFFTQIREKEHGIFFQNYLSNALQHNNLYNLWKPIKCLELKSGEAEITKIIFTIFNKKVHFNLISKVF